MQSGFDQIPGIAEKTAARIVEWRDKNEDDDLVWRDLQQLSGIGPKTVQKIEDFVSSDDPFGIYSLQKLLGGVRKDLPRLGLPSPTHVAVDVPYESGSDQEVVWLGLAVNRNLRDIFEANRSRTGEALNPDEVRDPHLNEWMLVAGYDGTDLLSLRVDRWKYPALRKILWKISLNEDVILVRGVKKGYRTAREIVVKQIWVLEP